MQILLDDRHCIRELNRTLAKTLRRATRVIAVSESTRRDLVELYHVESARITVVPLALGMWLVWATFLSDHSFYQLWRLERANVTECARLDHLFFLGCCND